MVNMVALHHYFDISRYRRPPTSYITHYGQPNVMSYYVFGINRFRKFQIFNL